MIPLLVVRVRPCLAYAQNMFVVADQVGTKRDVIWQAQMGVALENRPCYGRRCCLCARDRLWRAPPGLDLQANMFGVTRAGYAHGNSVVTA